MFVLIDVKLIEPVDVWLVGRFSDEAAVEKAVQQVQAHWETYNEGAEKDDHELYWFECESELNEVCLPEYDEEEDEDEGDDEDDEDLEEDLDEIEEEAASPEPCEKCKKPVKHSEAKATIRYSTLCATCFSVALNKEGDIPVPDVAR